jgi:hypothetical protein
MRGAIAPLLAALAAGATPGAILFAGMLVNLTSTFGLPASEGGSIVSALVGLMFISVLFGFPVALLHLALIGLPAHYLLSRYWRLRWWSAATGGIFAGLLPAALLSLALSQQMTSVAMGVLGASGLVGGLVFWAFERPGAVEA